MNFFKNLLEMVAKILATLLRIEGLLKLFNKHQDTVLISMADYLEQPIGQPVNVTVDVEAFRQSLMSDGETRKTHLPGLKMRVSKGAVIFKTFEMDQSKDPSEHQKFIVPISSETGEHEYKAEYKVGEGEWQTGTTFRVSWEEDAVTRTDIIFNVKQEHNTGLNWSNGDQSHVIVTAYTKKTYKSGKTAEVPFGDQSITVKAGDKTFTTFTMGQNKEKRVSFPVNREDAAKTNTVDRDVPSITWGGTLNGTVESGDQSKEITLSFDPNEITTTPAGVEKIIAPVSLLQSKLFVSGNLEQGYGNYVINDTENPKVKVLSTKKVSSNISEVVSNDFLELQEYRKYGTEYFKAVRKAGLGEGEWVYENGTFRKVSKTKHGTITGYYNDAVGTITVVLKSIAGPTMGYRVKYWGSTEGIDIPANIVDERISGLVNKSYRYFLFTLRADLMKVSDKTTFISYMKRFIDVDKRLEVKLGTDPFETPSSSNFDYNFVTVGNAAEEPELASISPYAFSIYDLKHRQNLWTGYRDKLVGIYDGEHNHKNNTGVTVPVHLLVLNDSRCAGRFLAEAVGVEWSVTQTSEPRIGWNSQPSSEFAGKTYVTGGRVPFNIPVTTFQIGKVPGTDLDRTAYEFIGFKGNTALLVEWGPQNSSTAATNNAIIYRPTTNNLIVLQGDKLEDGATDIETLHSAYAEIIPYDLWMNKVKKEHKDY